MIFALVVMVLAALSAGGFRVRVATLKGKVNIKGGSTISGTRGFPQNKLPKDLPKSTKCKQNGYFIDWGSSGMKVFLVHKPSDKQVGDVKLVNMVKEDDDGVRKTEVVKKAGKINTADITKGNIAAIMKKLSSRLASPGISPIGGIFATAGFRTKPSLSVQLWDAVKKAAQDSANLFASCSDDASEDCQTLAGSTEAQLEFQAALKELPADAGQEKHGFVSAGGASIQLGLRDAADHKYLEACATALKTKKLEIARWDSTFAKRRISNSSVLERPTLLMSFLADADVDARYRSYDPQAATDNDVGPLCTSESDICDLRVGGTNEMRANFDKFLKANGHVDNPCLDPGVELKTAPECRIFGPGVTKCVTDNYDSALTSLTAPGSLNKSTCTEKVKAFLATDSLLTAWKSETACTNLAAHQAKLLLLTSFRYPNTIGFDFNDKAAKDTNTMSFEALKGYVSEIDHANATNIEAKKVGSILTSTLLVEFLNELGFLEKTELKTSGKEWADAMLHQKGLQKGWITDDDASCSRVSKTESVKQQFGSRSRKSQVKTKGYFGEWSQS